MYISSQHRLTLPGRRILTSLDLPVTHLNVNKLLKPTITINTSPIKESHRMRFERSNEPQFTRVTRKLIVANSSYFLRRENLW